MQDAFTNSSPISIFYSYAREDEKLRRRLEQHLSLLRQQGVIAAWHHRQVLAGTEWEQDVHAHLSTASVILLLVSPAYFASDYCSSIEMHYALERHATKSARVIPILLRPVYWQVAPFAHLECLPRNEKPVTLWENQDQAFVEIVQAICAVIADLRGGTTSIRQRATRPATMSSRVTARGEEKNRYHFLKRVHALWIDGMLKRSIAPAGMIRGPLYEQPHTIVNPWKPLVQEIEERVQPVPPDTSIEHLYDNAQHALLILGAPGAGKTTLLLELARTLLARAHRDEHAPLPIVFNLSSWAEKRAPLSHWLIEEVAIRYQLPHPLAAQWIEGEQVILLLDGLDEVEGVHRRECVNAVNAYRREHAFVPVVVCSRTEAYLLQPSRLTLAKAISVEPLSFQQVDAYLERVGEQVEAIRHALSSDQDLRAVVTTPLLLNILVETYRGTSLDDLFAVPPEKRQQRLFQAYVDRMLARRKVEQQYTKEQTIQWLTWLARQMQQHDQTILYLEQMQPSWLAEQSLVRLYTLLAVRLPDMAVGCIISLVVVHLFFRVALGISFDLRYGLLGALVGGLLSGRQQELVVEEERSPPFWKQIRNTRLQRSCVVNGLLVGLSYGLLVGFYEHNSAIGFCYGLGYGCASYCLSFLLWRKQWPPARMGMLVRSWETFWHQVISAKNIRIGLTVGCCLALGYIVSTELAHHFQNTQSDVVAYALADLLNYTQVGLLLAILLERRVPDIRPAEIVTWSWKNLWYSFHKVQRLRQAVLIGILSGGVTGVSAWLRGTQGPGLDYGVSAGVIIGLCSWLFHGLSEGLSSTTLEANQRLRPNQGIWYSARNSLFIGVFSGVMSWGLYVLSTLIFDVSKFLSMLNWMVWSTIWSVVWWQIAMNYAVLIALGVGVLGAICNGGLACLQHIVFRWLLWRSKSLPWRSARFLDYADRHILLRKVGGGYTFIHRLLLDYFTSCGSRPQQGEDA
ncbi:hypothetical protein KSF_103980 [Reticulibacter mediterranei]|uniref:NACHT domain-containing protein n=1 Tax=Reticulibacter mediterranei TaxID=2778369 RepID=A0A8J3J113_9CHLR|nr:TIR domain-containing protein [Reticulibacter mediterranei]GHP00351.1 hypothetical protein KSF_103980 [Reticulibacter mediterranei]